MSRVKIISPPAFSKYLESFEAAYDENIPKLNYNKKNNQIVGDLTGKSRKIHLEKLYSKLFKYLDSNAPAQVSQVDALYLENLKGMITNETDSYKNRHSSFVLFFRRIFRGDVDKLSQQLIDKVDTLKKSHVDSGFSSYLSSLAPLTPVDVSQLSGTNFPRLVYVEQKGEVECDLTGTKPENIDLEKTYTILLNYFDRHSPTHVSQMDRLHLEILKGIITTQTEAYKNDHVDAIDELGYVNKLSDDLLDVIEELEKRANPVKKLKEDEIKSNLDHSRKEFQVVQDRFVLSMDAAAINIKILIKLCNDKQVEGADKLADYDEIFENLSISAHKVQILVNFALLKKTEIAQSEALAKIYKTDTFQVYVKEATLAAQAYEENLKSVISDLTAQHTLDKNDIEGLSLFGQPQDNFANGFVYSPNDRINGTVANCFAPPMQHIIRHAMLMETLEKNTPYEADEYDLVLEGAIEAKRGAGCMNFLI